MKKNKMDNLTLDSAQITEQSEDLTEKKIARGHRITVGSASKMVPGSRFNIFFTDNYFSLERIDQIFSQNLFHLLIN